MIVAFTVPEIKKNKNLIKLEYISYTMTLNCKKKIKMQQNRVLKKIKILLKNLMVFGVAKLYFSSNRKTGGAFYGKQIRNKLKKTQVDRMICYRVTTAANLKNVVLRKTRFKIKVLISLL